MPASPARIGFITQPYRLAPTAAVRSKQPQARHLRDGIRDALDDLGKD